MFLAVQMVQYSHQAIRGMKMTNKSGFDLEQRQGKVSYKTAQSRSVDETSAF